jgi:hypothetical protein
MIKVVEKQGIVKEISVTGVSFYKMFRTTYAVTEKVIICIHKESVMYMMLENSSILFNRKLEQLWSAGELITIDEWEQEAVKADKSFKEKTAFIREVYLTSKL